MLHPIQCHLDFHAYAIIIHVRLSRVILPRTCYSLFIIPWYHCQSFLYYSSLCLPPFLILHLFHLNLMCLPRKGLSRSGYICTTSAARITANIFPPGIPCLPHVLISERLPSQLRHDYQEKDFLIPDTLWPSQMAESLPIFSPVCFPNTITYPHSCSSPIYIQICFPWEALLGSSYIRTHSTTSIIANLFLPVLPPNQWSLD